MNNLFSVFDPNVGWFGMNANWLSLALVLVWIPSVFWKVKSSSAFVFSLFLLNLAKEFKNNFSPITTPGHTHWALRVFLLILLNNLVGLTPYTFTRTRHLSVSVRLALSGWLSYWTASLVIDPGSTLAHLVPLGTPYILIPFIVIIELVRNLIRPLTLSVRLAANIVAGHLLITLISTPLTSRAYLTRIFILIGLILLIILERAVAFIQAYVFRMLRTLYLSESNSLKLNYLCNLLFIDKIDFKFFSKFKIIRTVPLASWILKLPD